MQKLLLTNSQEQTNAQPISKEWLPWKDSIVADHDVKWHGHLTDRMRNREAFEAVKALPNNS